MTVEIHVGDCREVLPTLESESVECVVTSPPYWNMRDYGVEGAIGLEPTFDEHLEELVSVFDEVKRVLRPDGTLWLNYGDAYAGAYKGGGGEGLQRSSPGTRIRYSAQPAGLKTKDLMMMPARVAIALQAAGWFLRSEIIWHKRNPMPESVRDRPTNTHEKLFLLTKNPSYWYDAEAVKVPSSPNTHARRKDGEIKPRKGKDPTNRRPGTWHHHTDMPPTRNLRNVWTIQTEPFPEAHFATFPPSLVEPCIKAGCPPIGKRCDCAEIIRTPQPDGVKRNDPTMQTGRRGMNRERNPNSPRPITRYEQRQYAEQIRESPYKHSMRDEAGTAFDHYIRTDRVGARPVPEELLRAWIRRGWLVEAERECDCAFQEAGTVMDPFGGAGTVGLVANRYSRHAVLIELNREYAEIAERRIRDDAPLLADVRIQGVQ